MSECEICRDSREDHDFIGSDHISKRDEITRQLLEVCKSLVEDILWCGGSSDFGPCGQAEKGWKKVVPTIEAAKVAIAAAEGE